MHDLQHIDQHTQDQHPYGVRLYDIRNLQSPPNQTFGGI